MFVFFFLCFFLFYLSSFSFFSAEEGKYFEGDILLPSNTHHDSKRSMIQDIPMADGGSGYDSASEDNDVSTNTPSGISLWPNKKIYYKIDEDLSKW